LTTKEWLMRAWRIDKEIETLIRSRDAAYNRCTAITQSYAGDCVSNTKDPHEKFDSLAEYEIEIDAKVDALIGVKREIEAAVSRVENSTYRDLLRRRYLCFDRWEQIAVDMNYNYHYLTVDLHPQALEAAETVLKKTDLLST